MPHIQLLKKEIAELIAAGEVVERPASVAKELIENSIDASARHITVEIRRGGISLLRITDDGCGIAAEDVPTAFLRHATSKISSAEDLDSISSLGFRGEALAATSAVSRVELITRRAEDESGTHYMTEGGTETLFEETGCAAGTTIIVNDIFYNTPARMKFLKKDVSEGNAVAVVVDRAALSHPEISFKFIREGRQTLSTPGDGRLESAVYSVLGRDFARSVIPVSAENGGITVDGLICRPVNCRSSRSLQFTFLNGRFVQSGTVVAAVEQAYKHSVMVGKFPAFVLNISLPFGAVDVNVHPAKTQVRFSDEKAVFEAVYFAVRAALSKGDTRPQLSPAAKRKAESISAFADAAGEKYKQQVFGISSAAGENRSDRPADSASRRVSETASETASEIAPGADSPKAAVTSAEQSRLSDNPGLLFDHPAVRDFVRRSVSVDITREPEELNAAKPAAETAAHETAAQNEPSAAVSDNAAPEGIAAETAKTAESAPAARNGQPAGGKPADERSAEAETAEPIRFIGEAFSTYIIAEKGDSVFLIDKHAAHERILFEQLRASGRTEVQQLLAPVRLTLGKQEYDAAINNLSLLAEAGFEAEDFGNGTVIFRSVPAALSREDAAAVCEEAVAGLVSFGSVDRSRTDDLYHMIACKAATKGGYRSSAEELKTLAERILSSNDIMYCPHGRPVAFEIKRRELEKQFGRIQ